MTNNILILGGAGFVGTNLALHLSNRYNITVFDNLVRRGSEVNLKELKKNDIEFVHGDIRNKEDFNNLSKTYDSVLLCAAQPSATNYGNPEFDITNNTIGVLNTLEFIRGSESSLIFWSTNKVYPQSVTNQFDVVSNSAGHRYLYEFSSINDRKPYWNRDHGFNEKTPVDGGDHSIYGLSKVMSDIMIQEWADAYKIPSIINRFSCLSGPRQWGKAEQGWVTWFAIANELGLPIEIFGYNGLQVRDCLFIEDLCNLIDLQLAQLHGNSRLNFIGKVYNVGGGPDNTLSIREAINYLELVNKKFVNITEHSEPRRADQQIYISDITRVKNEFNWSPKIQIMDGYLTILQWVKENKKKLGKLYK